MSQRFHRSVRAIRRSDSGTLVHSFQDFLRECIASRRTLSREGEHSSLARCWPWLPPVCRIHRGAVLFPPTFSSFPRYCPRSFRFFCTSVRAWFSTVLDRQPLQRPWKSEISRTRQPGFIPTGTRLLSSQPERSFELKKEKNWNFYAVCSIFSNFDRSNEGRLFNSTLVLISTFIHQFVAFCSRDQKFF